MLQFIHFEAQENLKQKFIWNKDMTKTQMILSIQANDSYNGFHWQVLMILVITMALLLEIKFQ